MTIEELGRKLCTGTVEVRGQELSIAAISDKVLQRVAEAFAQPRAPLIKDPHKGSLAPSIVDAQDEKYRKLVRAWNVQTRAAQAVIALDLAFTFEGQSLKMSEVMGFDDAAFGVRLQAAVEQVRNVLDTGEIDRVVEAVDELTMSAKERAAKNS